MLSNEVRKKERRKELVANLQRLSDSEYQNFSIQISKNVHSFIEQNLQGHLFFGGFSPSRELIEPNWAIHLSEHELKCIAFPIIQSDQLIFKHASLANLKPSQASRKISEPDHKEVSINKDTMPFVLIPGLGFSRSGLRLGRGGGFYDRFLDGYTGKKIGIAFSCQIIDELPEDKWDIKMDLVITEKEIIGVT